MPRVPSSLLRVPLRRIALGAEQVRARIDECREYRFQNLTAPGAEVHDPGLALPGALVGRGCVGPHVRVGPVDISDPEPDQFPGAGRGVDLEEHDRMHRRGHAGQGALDAGENRRAHRWPIRCRALARAEPLDSLESLEQLRFRKFFAHGPAEHALDRTGAPVDHLARQPRGDPHLAQRLERFGAERGDWERAEHFANRAEREPGTGARAV
ncbi:hypothetical protein [Gemmata massiliana]|uniref:hypothetical protein n=1 Tax=Gemmata massiliana TaxID=1210884 RepID=UPI0013A6B918